MLVRATPDHSTSRPPTTLPGRWLQNHGGVSLDVDAAGTIYAA
jgi:hypothetical protein